MSVSAFVTVLDNYVIFWYSLLHKNCDFLQLKLYNPYKDLSYKGSAPVPTLHKCWSCEFSNISNFLYTGRFSENQFLNGHIRNLIFLGSLTCLHEIWHICVNNIDKSQGILGPEKTTALVPFLPAGHNYPVASIKLSSVYIVAVA